MIVWTDRLLAIPGAVAREFARGDDQLAGELESVGNLALVQAAQIFDPAKSPDGEDGLAAFLVERVRLTVKRELTDPRSHRNRWRRLASTADGATPSATVSTAATVELSDLSAEVLRRLKPIERACVLLCHRDGLTQAEAGARLGLGRDAVRDHLSRAGTRIARSRLGCASARNGRGISDAAIEALLNVCDRRRQQWRCKLAHATSQSYRARHALGKLPLHRKAWYFVDHAGRHLYGPACSLWDLYQDAGVTLRAQPPRRAARKLLADRFHLPAVNGPQARSLLASGYTCLHPSSLKKESPVPPAFLQMALDLRDLWNLIQHPEHGETAALSYREHLLELRQAIDAELAVLGGDQADTPPVATEGEVSPEPLPEKSAGLDPSRRGSGH